MGKEEGAGRAASPQAACQSGEKAGCQWAIQFLTNLGQGLAQEFRITCLINYADEIFVIRRFEFHADSVRHDHRQGMPSQDSSSPILQSAERADESAMAGEGDVIR